MWQQIVAFGRQLLAVVRKQEQHEQDIKELRQEDRDLRQEIKDLRQEDRDLRQEINLLRQEFSTLLRVVERLSFELERDRTVAAQAQEIIRLRLENLLLRHERALPPRRADEEVSGSEGGT